MFDIYSLPEFQMPEGFLWGAGYAGHQVEGDNVNSMSWYREIREEYEAVSGKACNSYELWQTDIDLAVQAGLRAFRTSVEWSRIEPREGVFDEAAAEHYVALFAGLKEKGIQVFATLVHIAHPQWFEEKGHFTTLDNLKYFERYLEFIVPKIAPYVDFWNVLNEFNLRNTPEWIDFKLCSIRYHAMGYHIINSNFPH